MAQLWFLMDYWTTLVVGTAGLWHLFHTERRHHRKWLCLFAVVSAAGAAVSSGPTPYVMTAVALFVLVAVWRDPLNPDTLRFRSTGGMMVYGLAAIGGEMGIWTLTQMDIESYADAITGQGDAVSMVSSARSGLHTLLGWGLWVILPAGILGMVVQGMVTHPPMANTPTALIDLIRSGNYRGDYIQPLDQGMTYAEAQAARKRQGAGSGGSQGPAPPAAPQPGGPAGPPDLGPRQDGAGSGGTPRPPARPAPHIRPPGVS